MVGCGEVEFEVVEFGEVKFDVVEFDEVELEVVGMTTGRSGCPEMLKGT